MAAYTLRDVDAALWKKLKIKAAQQGKPIRTVINTHAHLARHLARGLATVWRAAMSAHVHRRDQRERADLVQKTGTTSEAVSTEKLFPQPQLPVSLGF